MNFIKTTAGPETPLVKAYYFIFSGNRILVEKRPDALAAIPCLEQAAAAQMGLSDICVLGQRGQTFCYCAGAGPEKVPNPYEWINLRALYGRVETEVWGMAGYARQIHDWDMNFKFCGRCSARTTRAATEHSRVCKVCGLTSYPRISPAIITAVVKDHEILLARGVNFPDRKMFSVLAGFVEPGESLEECVKREIYEEVGIQVKQIHYFNSQPWPFPDSLMIGFTAVYDSGNLVIDENEILEAGWFKADQLPVIPKRYTLAGQLIQWFVSGQHRQCMTTPSSG